MLKTSAYTEAAKHPKAAVALGVAVAVGLLALRQRSDHRAQLM